MIPDDLLLLDPWFLAAIPLVVLLAWLGARRRPSAVPTASAQLLEGLPVTLRQRLAPLPRLLWTLGVVAVVVALARPVTREILPLTAQGLDIVLLVDVSSSMNYTDVERTGTRRRMDAARDRAMEFAAARDRDRVGLVALDGRQYPGRGDGFARRGQPRRPAQRRGRGADGFWNPGFWRRLPAGRGAAASLCLHALRHTRGHLADRRQCLGRDGRVLRQRDGAGARHADGNLRAIGLRLR